MPYADGLMNTLGPLSAYGEYKEEAAPQSGRGTDFVPSNHLSGAQSPYLRQHISDPVGWMMWGDEVFSSAKAYDRPVFLSIGYSASHWCRIMGRDCWLDPETAGIINSICIPVLADREELPALDYAMTEICRLQNGSAGYPLNIFMTSSGRPFMCVTWLPKRTMGRMIGITEIMPRIKWLWNVQRDDVERAADDLSLMFHERLSALSGGKSSSRVGKFTAYQALDDMRSIFDIRWGGFGSSPKYPEHDKLLFLAHQSGKSSPASQHDKSDASTMTDITLRRMWRGGIHDHLGGGFSLCSSDEQWLVPHFEKLLCTNAMLLMTASMNERNSPGSFNRLLAEDIIFSLTKDFADSSSYSQGFASSVDGDTADGEGRYYLWNENEIKSLLGENAGLFCAAYAVLPSGNFGSEISGSQMSWNILYEASTVTELARRYGLRGGDVASRLYEARKILLDYRDKRYPLLRDNKILMSWNGLAIAALSHASVSFNVKEWLDLAERTALFITRNFADKSGKWLHVWVDGKSYVPAMSEDLAYMLWGIIELYKAASHFNAGEKQLSEWLNMAKTLADSLIDGFLDGNGGLFMTTEPVIPSLPRIKSAEDMNSLPSANAAAAMMLDELAFMLEDKKYSDISRAIIGCFARYVRENPLKCLTMITADLEFKAFKPKKKPEPAPKPVPTDEELNREEADSQPQEQTESKPRSPRSRRGHNDETTQAGRNDRASRRSARPHRTRER